MPLDDIINSCRICLEINYSDCVSFDDEHALLKMYEFCFSLFISSQDMPRKVCSKCVKKIEEFFKLKQKAIDSDKLWRNKIPLKSEPVKEIATDHNDVFLDVKEENYGSESDAPFESTHYVFNIENDISTKEEKDSDTNESKEYVLENIFNASEDESKTLKKKKRTKKGYKKKCKKRKDNEMCQPQPTLVKPVEISCGLCDEKSSNADDIKEHLRTHFSNNDLACKLCEYTGRDLADMEAHRYHHIDSLVFTCHSCNKRCMNILSLQYHYRAVHLNKTGGKCSMCNKVYNSYKSFRDHNRWHNTPGFICDHCGRRFLYRNSIEAHLKDHANYKPYICDKCGRNFKRLSGLRLHIAQVHDTKRVTCTHCNRTFKNEKNRNIHLLRETREKKLRCEFCSKCFSSASLLRNHMVFHKDERPFACEICGGTYKVKNQLKIHMRGHTGDYPYKCTVAQCPKAFASSNQLKVHLTVHSGVRRYKCSYCERTFHNRKDLVTHCARRHADVDVLNSKKTIDDR